MCAKNDLIRRKSLLSTSTQTSNYVNTFSLDFAFSFTNILSLITFIISYCLFADKLNIQQSLLDRATVMLIIILRSTPSTLLAKFIPITKIRNPLLKTLENIAKSRILLACADRRIRQCYLTICAILKHYNFNIYVSLATDTLYLLLKGLTSTEQKAIIQQLIAIVSLLFILKAPFTLHFIHAVYNLHALTHIIQDIRIYRALDSICTRANSKVYYITILILEIQPYLIKLLLSEVAANIAISNFIHAAAQSSSKRHNDPKHCNKEVLYLILIIINYTCYNKDRKHIAYIRAFSKVLLFNNNRQINNTTRILSVPFKFYDLSTIIRLVHLVLRDLPNLITYTTMSYYVNNYIN
ncbi:hypothetical protein HBH64_249300 [Parastagonospora nodorum]|nr:hypothetical protein HBI01_249910 [Parastagonospora nodorum]KAH4565847.1 hypothetical protein HBH83_248250 [Parastagonospora nodorum]KAH4651463.1 hypothetical protein HBH79_247160 [Parastagonospora nodorum]KAH4653572.1 hypothetical protein HBH80_181990 [Parastagonospora nodorum]KAH4715357.1 hypothetical protein HBH66_249980 [Parastagonospora nodorum]